jgi:hypothetical protein
LSSHRRRCNFGRFFGGNDQSSRPASPPTPAVSQPQSRIAYDVVRQWTIPNGGFGRVVVISKANAKESGLRALGETLKYDTASDRNTFVFIFDDRRAAAMYERALNLNKKDGRFYDRHFVAMYSRNINTGLHRLDILKETTSVIRVDYRWIGPCRFKNSATPAPAPGRACRRLARASQLAHLRPLAGGSGRRPAIPPSALSPRMPTAEIPPLLSGASRVRRMKCVARAPVRAPARPAFLVRPEGFPD